MSESWLFHSGTIFDGHSIVPSGHAVAVRDGTIVAIGQEAAVRELLPAPDHDIHLGQGMLGPGFTDAHVHTVMGGIESLACDMSGADSLAATLEAITAYAATSTEDWITGGGWSMNDFPGGTPTASMLDALIPDRPAYLLNRDHHGAWVNSSALRLAGITATTPDPADGRIERDEYSVPTGTLHEGAMSLVADFIPRPDAETLRAGLLAGQQQLHSFGITGWQEAILGSYAGYSDVSGAYRELNGEGLLTGQAAGALWVPRDITASDVPGLINEFLTRRTENAAAGFRTTTAKIMVDGVAENQSAAMLDPYLRPCRCGSDPTGNRGLRYLEPEVLTAVVVALDAAGFDLHFHVIGDAATRMALDALAECRRLNHASTQRHHLAHVQVIHPSDVPRFGALSLSVNAQALWACNDAQMTELTTPFLGQERAAWQYPFRSLVDAGANLVMGSDWPVSTPNPMAAIHVAVNRTHPDVPDAAPLIPDQAITVHEAMVAYTRGSAWINRSEGGGVIAEGARADLVVLDADPFAIKPQQLFTVRVLLTLAAGQIVFASADSPAMTSAPTSPVA